MSSSIDITVPDATAPTTASVRANFSTAKDEIEALQTAPVVTLAASTPHDNERVLTGTANEITVTDGGAGTTATLSLPASMTFTGKTVTGGTYDQASITTNVTLFGDIVAVNPSQSVLQLQSVGDSKTMSVHLSPSSGTLPTDTISEFVLYQTLAQDFGGNYGRWSFTCFGTDLSNAAGIYGEYGGSTTPGPFIFNLGVEDPASTFTSHEYLRLVTDGSDIGNVQYGVPATTPRDVLQLEMANIGSAGTRDSHAIKWRGKANDGTERSVDWRAYTDVTSNAGASSFVIENNLNGGGWTKYLDLTNGGVLTGITFIGVGAPAQYTGTFYTAGNAFIHVGNATTGAGSSDGALFGYASGSNALRLNNQEAGDVWLMTNGNIAVQVPYVASIVNRFSLSASATGNPLVISAVGSDTNIDIEFTPKGAGNVRFGTHTTLSGESVTGYITIKDAGGTPRKVAIVS